MFSSEDGYGRMVIKETPTYVSVASSVILGAIADGDSLNLKAYLLSETIDRFLGIYTGIEDSKPVESTVSYTNYPNPFSDKTRIDYTIEENAFVSIDIFNTTGQFVKRLASSDHAKGQYSVTWNATNDSGRDVPNGIYYFRITAGKSIQNGKMILYR